MSKHTQGPWIAEESLTPDGKGTGTYNIHQNSEDGHWLAFVGAKDDARLIAAAPEMLDALRVAQSELHYFIATRGREAHEIVRAAIAKATGEEI